ncbi:8024_t:CDS:2, partial [Scutellospora calospora]
CELKISGFKKERLKIRANTIVRKIRSDKKDTISKCCSHEYSTSQKLHEHLKRKNLCKLLQKQKEVVFIQVPIQMPIQKAIQQAIQTSKIKAQGKPYMVILIQVSELEPEKKAPVLKLDLDNEPLKVNDLDTYKTLFHNLEQYDPNAVHLLTLKELEEYKKREIKNNKSSYSEASYQSKNLINKEFERLEEIKEHKKSEKDLEFREQEELGTAVKRRAIAIHRAKVPKSYPDNGSDI